jgi:F-type H+-transporting ATPase subunit b
MHFGLFLPWEDPLFPRLLSAGLIDLDITFVVQLALFVAFALLARVLAFKPLLRLFQERRERGPGALAEAQLCEGRATGLEEHRDRDLTQAAARKLAAVTARREELARQEEAAIQAHRDRAAAELGREKETLATQEKALASQLDGAARDLAKDLASRMVGRS